MSHPCPVPGGTATVYGDMLMCRTHWYTVPLVIRRALWSAWRNGAGMGTAEHVAAMRACVHAADSSLPCHGAESVSPDIT